MAERQKNGEKVPNVTLCPHENTAAHMAMGYAAVTGRGQAVLVHVDVGTANTANGMHNLFRSRLPVLLNGRVKPMDTVARTTLLMLQGQQRVAAGRAPRRTGGRSRGL